MNYKVQVFKVEESDKKPNAAIGDRKIGHQ